MQDVNPEELDTAGMARLHEGMANLCVWEYSMGGVKPQPPLNSFNLMTLAPCPAALAQSVVV